LALSNKVCVVAVDEKPPPPPPEEDDTPPPPPPPEEEALLSPGRSLYQQVMPPAPPVGYDAPKPKKYVATTSNQLSLLILQKGKNSSRKQS